jgi:hypothetical protein
MRNVSHAIVALRPPQRLLEAVDEAAFERKVPRSAVIREALETFKPAPRNPDAPCPVRSLYVRLNSRLTEVPVGFSARPSEVERYQKVAKRSGVPSLNGLVSLAIAQHLSV